MISSVFRMARTMLPGSEPTIARAAHLPFQSPIFPTAARPMIQRRVDHLQTRAMGNWTILQERRTKTKPECYISPNAFFVLPNLNFSREKDALMKTNLKLYKTNNFRHIRLERGALIANSEWLHELLTHISESGGKTIDIVALANTFRYPKVMEWIEPSVSKVRNEGVCLNGLDQRPEVLKMSQVRLTKGMINALTDLMTYSSHGVAFELNIRN